MESKKRVKRVAKVTKKNKIDLIPYGYRGEGVVVPGLTPVPWGNISVIETSMNKPTNKSEMEKALQNTKQIDSARENATVKQILNSTPSVLQFYQKDPFTEGREPGSGPVDLDVEEVKEKLDFSDENTPIMDNEDFKLMDIHDIHDIHDIRTDKEQPNGGKRCHRKMKTRKALRKSKRGKKHSSSRKMKSKKRRTSVRRR
jgi:uncharacterized protein YfkK (UPF0435 family)